MKYLLFLSFYLISYNISYSQFTINLTPKITFQYDASGNQTLRCYNCYLLRKASKTANKNNDKKFEKETSKNIDNIFSYFPNPVDDKLVLNWSSNALTKVYILDMNSKLLANYDVSIKEKQYTIPFTNYIQGIYIVKVVFDDNSTKTFKIIKK